MITEIMGSGALDFRKSLISRFHRNILHDRKSLGTELPCAILKRHLGKTSQSKCYGS